jgi:hypothetical protein
MANLVRNTTITNLGEFDFLAPEAGNYVINGTLQLPNQIVPTAAQGPGGGGIGTSSVPGIAIPSQVVTVIKLNSTTKYTSNAGDRGFSTGIVGVAQGDTIKVILSSSLAQDNQPEAVQCTLSIFED